LLTRHESGWLDAGAPQREPLAQAAFAPGSVTEDPSLPADNLLARAPAGGWRVHPHLLWSLLDPLVPRPLPDSDQRAALRRLWARLGWWQGLPASERLAIAGLLDHAAAEGSELLAVWQRLAAAGNPFGVAAPATAPPAPDASATAIPPPLDPAALAAFMTDPAGLGRRYGRAFTPRPQQADLAAAVARALQAGSALVAEAGTGTGKTLAYLAPLVARLGEGRSRAVIATYSRALQGQILDGDLPLLLAGRTDITARLLMGRAHYLCLRQRRAFLTRAVADPRQVLATAALRCWLLATTDGLRDELSDHPLLAADLRQLFSGVQPCTPDCWEGHDCFVVRARRQAREAPLVVVNHALLLSDQAADGALIGPFAHLVVDEAHRLPQVILDARTVRLGHDRLVDLQDLLGTVRPAGQAPEVATLLAASLRALADPRLADAATDFGQAANRCLRAYQDWWQQVGQRLAPGPEAAPGQRVRIADKDVAFASLREATARLLDAAASASAAAARLNQRTETALDITPAITDLLARCAQAGQLCDLLQRDVRFVTSDPSDRWVTWLEPATRGGLRWLGATPLESGPLLREFWSENGLAPVATSATLAIGQDFSFMLGELGLSGRRPPTQTVTVASPFIWEEQTRCLGLETMPDPEHADFAEAIAAVLADLRREVPRQTLVLFTAYRLLQDVAERLRRLDAADGLFAGARSELLVQAPLVGAGELRERFRRGRQAMLLGTSTFWEGVDFPGESLEIVVVTRLPFLVPSDPWVQARCDHLRACGEDPFRTFMLRDAVLRLRQGIGRLLRRSSDRGVAILLDNRLIKRGYGTTFLGALPTSVHWLADRQELATAARDFLDRA